MRSLRVSCLGGASCRRAPAETVYVDGHGRAWGLCGRRQCRDAYNGVEGPPTVAREVKTAADHESKENPFLELMRKGRA